MSTMLDPQGVQSALEDGTVKSIEDFFPLVGKKRTLVAKKIYTTPPPGQDDLVAQKRARMRGRTYSQGVFGDFDLVDNETGAVIDSASKLRVLNLPRLTRRYSYIVDGTEYQVDNQWRLKSGVYARRKANGELESQFNLEKGRGFRLKFEPEKSRFLMQYGTSNIQLLPILQALGVPDEEIQKAWGKDMYARAVAGKRRGEVLKLAKALDRRTEAKSDTEAAEAVSYTHLTLPTKA